MRQPFGKWLRTLRIAALFGAAALLGNSQTPDGADLHVLPVQGDVYLIAGAGGNIAVDIGPQGVLLVDTGRTEMSERVIGAIRKLTNKPIRYILNTSVDPDHTGGNEKLRNAGMTVAGALFQSNELDVMAGANIVSHENVLNRMSGVLGGKATASVEAFPLDTYFGDTKRMYFNEGIAVMHMPAAHTDGDSIVQFRHSDVIATGEIFITTGFPVIDLQKGGSIRGIVDGLNRILDLTIAKQEVEGGTYIIPGRGRICDQFDVLEYRDMLVIIRDRIQDMLKREMTLEQVIAAHPTEDYDARYGSTSGAWTTEMFIEAVYKSFKDQK
jgi:cyclase